MTTASLRSRLPRFSGILNDRTEESLRLRVLILLTTGWVALAFNWVTGDYVIPGAAVILTTLGHWTSWRWRYSPLGVRSTVIVVAVAGLAVFSQDDFISAITADRLPIAGFLLMISGVASFGIKTRGGLYALMILSGIVLFFVSERAFDQTFVGFLIVFIGLFLTFHAMAFLEDQISIARVHWPEGQLGRFWFWLGIVGGGLIVCSALAFALMPPDFRGRPGSQRVGVVPFMGEGGFSQTDAPPNTAGPIQPEGGADGDTDPSAAGVSELTQPGQGLDAPSMEQLAQGFEGQQVSGDPRDVVMRVRSPVTSYWRGRIFDRFDGAQWKISVDPPTSLRRRTNENFYWQAFFIEQDQPGALFVGYDGRRVLLPDEIRSRGRLEAGDIYSALSQRPVLETRAMQTERIGTPGGRYLQLPEESDRYLRDLSFEITEEARSSFEVLWLIVSYMRQNHTYDPTAPNQLQLSPGGIERFLQPGTSGTSIDFATATVLLARATGLPARLAAGYLPGRFDPFSGTHRVRNRDAHAWAEINFRTAGWVSFDGTPRPELEVFQSGEFADFGGTSFIFQTRVGGGLYRVIQEGTSNVVDDISQALQGQAGLVRGVVAAIGVVAVIATIIWLVVRRARRVRGPRWRYTRLPGGARRDILKTYAGVERLVRRRGLDPRGASQTVGEYTSLAARRLIVIEEDLRWFARAAWVAAYDPSEPSPEMAKEASVRFERLNGLDLNPSEA